MPWPEVDTVSLRREFVVLAGQPGANVAELCRRFGISRKTGYKMLGRFRVEGLEGLEDQPRRPYRSPRRTESEVEALVVELRQQLHWGGRKLRHLLLKRGIGSAPAPSTISGILRRHGLIEPAESSKHRAFQRFEREEPNALWQMDFKGHFPIGQERCHPLTVLDDHSRYSIALQACANERTATVQERLTGAFRRYGLPEQMLMDNGSPWNDESRRFVFTPLVLWLIRLGIQVLHGRPYHPQTQGKDERFHRTLDDELLRHHHFRSLPHCQGHFDRWRELYNYERPHESLGMATPSKRYRPSLRRYPEQLPAIEYGSEHPVRRVQAKGEISFRGHIFGLNRALRGYPVVLKPTQDEALYRVYFCNQPVGQIDLRQPKA
jgi:transposase InsO family protein